MSRDASSPAPPVRVAFRVGITGHRDLSEADPDAIRGAIHRVLVRIRDSIGAAPMPRGCNPSEPVILRFVSPLAAGSDQIGAEVALELGYELQCPIPFRADQFREDFRGDENARSKFGELLSRASAVMEVHTHRDGGDVRGDAYLAAGRVVVSQSDLLLAVWDGKPAAGTGGTGQIVEEAIGAGQPVIHVPPRDPDAFRLAEPVEGGTVASPLDAIAAEVMHLLAPYADGETSPDIQAQVSAYDRFLAERPRQPTAPRAGASLDAHHRWADGLAGRYAGLYQRSFIVNYLLGALAVTLGLLAFLYHSIVLPLAIGEFLSVVVILVVYGLGRRGGWRERAAQYRTLAEKLRTLAALAPVGLAVPNSRPPAHQEGEGDLGSAWTTWHVRAITRTLPLPDVTCDEEYRETQRMRLLAWAETQRRYYSESASRASRRHHRLETFAFLVFLVVAAAVLADIVLAVLHLPHVPGGVFRAVVLLGVALPAWGSATHAILAQSESHRLAVRYAAMARRLRVRLKELEAAGTRTEHAGFWVLWPPARATALDLVGEVADWQLLHAPHAIPLP